MYSKPFSKFTCLEERGADAIWSHTSHGRIIPYLSASKLQSEPFDTLPPTIMEADQAPLWRKMIFQGPYHPLRLT